ncbi:hypothetical protein HNQ93_001906 [Hymenobacter luteus]|uniref:Uncharacterized protein n=2 Tax=Hymenobacter TaxID=89966 RepID=A0A7W9WC33_9BACT|nr:MULTISPECIES: hypothetical protein [Hymenobacter]MBB4600733.1 hypothetical protein [Hymenobacter latericoloratus]MBB6059060.1 hypothetical protein [Hymenobacter luteus]
MAVSPWVIQLADWSEPVAYWSLVFPLLMAGRRWGSLSSSLRILAYLAAYMLVVYLLMRVAARVWHNNIILAHCASVGETILYLFAFRAALRRLPRYWFAPTLVAFLAFACLDSWVLEGFTRLNSYTLSLEGFLGILLGLLYFEQELHQAPASSVPMLARPLVVACMGIVLYLAGTIMVYSLSNHFIATNDAAGTALLYSVNSIMLCVLSGSLFYAFYLTKP